MWLIGCGGKTFQLNMSMPCVVPPMLWSLDELKSSLLDEFPILITSEGEGYQILSDSFVQWLEITCLLFFRSGEFGGIWGCWGLFPPRILRNQRTPRVTSHSARILRNHRTRRAYSEIIVLDRWERIPQKSEKIGKKRKKEKKKKEPAEFFFLFFLFRLKSFGIW